MKSNSNAPDSPHVFFRRRRKLIKPGLQIRLIVTFVALSAIGLLLQAVLISSELTRLGLQGSSGGLPSDIVPGLMLRVLAYSFLGLLPLTVAVGVLTTFRIAGPIYRFEQHLTAVAEGRETKPCKLRKGDELHDLCDRINETVEALRKEHVPEEGGEKVRQFEQRAA